MRAAVGVVDQLGQFAALAAALPDGALQRVEGEIGPQAGRGPPAHGPAGEQVDDEAR
jgi:hypothetical protein